MLVQQTKGIDTMNYIYSVVTTGEDFRITEETNSIHQALEWFFESVNMNLECHIASGVTGEVLALHGEEDFCTPEMALMINGYFMELEWGPVEDEEEECEPDIPHEVIPTIFDVMSALCGHQIAELGLSPEEVFLFPPVFPSDDESEIVG